MSDEQPTPDSESFALAAAMACQYMAAYHAGDAQAEPMLRALVADPRGLAGAFNALCETFISVVTRLERDGALEGGVQVFLDRMALNYGAAADEVVTRYRGDEGTTPT